MSVCRGLPTRPLVVSPWSAPFIRYSCSAKGRLIVPLPAHAESAYTVLCPPDRIISLEVHLEPEIHAARACACARLLADAHRPLYHVVTPEGVCAPFDPNGALFGMGATTFT